MRTRSQRIEQSSWENINHVRAESSCLLASDVSVVSTELGGKPRRLFLGFPLLFIATNWNPTILKIDKLLCWGLLNCVRLCRFIKKKSAAFLRSESSTKTMITWSTDCWLLKYFVLSVSIDGAWLPQVGTSFSILFILICRLCIYHDTRQCALYGIILSQRNTLDMCKIMKSGSWSLQSSIVMHQ